MGALEADGAIDLQAAEVVRLRSVDGAEPGTAFTRAAQRLPSDMMAFLAAGPSAIAAARGALAFAASLERRAAPWYPLEGLDLGPVVPRPQKVFVMRGNYLRHRAEMAPRVDPNRPDRPRYFVKPSTTITGHGRPIVYPRISNNVHHEIELAVVIGCGGRWISPDQVRAHLAGYTILLDMTARDLSGKDDRNKSIDTFAPIGPCLVPPDDLGEPDELTLTLRVNGEVRQHGSTRDLEFRIPEIVAFISEAVTLAPGDIISTGTPEGVGPVVPGDVIEAQIDGIGTLRCPVVAESPAGPGA